MTEDTPTPGAKRTALEAAKLGNVKDKTFVITGAYSGIGVCTTEALLTEGCGGIVIGGRNSKLLEEFTNKMKEDFPDAAAGGVIDSCVIDLSDLSSVQKFSKYVLGSDKGYKDIVLINNAGVMNTPAGLTKDGFEQQMGVNAIGHFLLAKNLASITARQVWVSSIGHTMDNCARIDIEKIKKYRESLDGYDGWSAYQQSKLGDILLPREFIKRYEGMEAGSLHPGGIQTKLNRHTGFFATIKFLFTRLPELRKGGNIVMKTPEVGASTTVTVATMPSEQLVNGGYYDNCELGKEGEAAKNEEDAAALFDYCDEVTKKFQ